MSVASLVVVIPGLGSASRRNGLVRVANVFVLDGRSDESVATPPSLAGGGSCGSL
jgi:hypothetical protein